MRVTHLHVSGVFHSHSFNTLKKGHNDTYTDTHTHTQRHSHRHIYIYTQNTHKNQHIQKTIQTHIHKDTLTDRRHTLITHISLHIHKLFLYLFHTHPHRRSLCIEMSLPRGKWRRSNPILFSVEELKKNLGSLIVSQKSNSPKTEGHMP